MNSQIFEYERHLPGQDVSLLSDDHEDGVFFRRIHRRHVDPHGRRLWIEERKQWITELRIYTNMSTRTTDSKFNIF